MPSTSHRFSTLFTALITSAALLNPSTAIADPASDCTDFGGISSTQVCIGEGRTWILTDDDSLTSFPFVVTFNGNLNFDASAMLPNPGNLGPNDIDKFYIITEHLFFVPVDERQNFPDEILGPFQYGEAPGVNSIVFGFNELSKILAMQAMGNIVILEQQAGHDIFNPLVEAFGPIEFTGTLPPAPPPTDVTGTSGANFNYSATCGEPINLFTGELFNQYPADINLGGPLHLSFSRYYASGLKQDGINGHMGDNWRHNFEWQLDRTDSTIDIVNHLGRLIRFGKNQGNWQQTTVLDISYQLVEDSESSTITLLDPRDNHAYVFDANGLLSSHSDNIGNTHTLSYDDNKLLTKVSDGLGRTLNFGYDESERLTGVNDGMGRTIGLSYTDNALTQFTDMLGNISSYHYTGAALMTDAKRPLGNSHHSQSFNEQGKVTSQTDALANLNVVTYGDNTTWTDPLGNIFDPTHTSKGAVANVVRQDGSSIQMTSNEAGRRNSITNALGDTTSYSYDVPSGRLAGTAHANGTTTTYDFSTRVLADHTAVFENTGITHADDSTESFSFNTSGNLASYTNQLGDAVLYTNNENGQWVTRTNALGGTITRAFNADGTLASNKDVSGNTTSYGYDATRRLTTITFADGNTQTFTYDLMDRPLTLTDGKGKVTTYSYDTNGNQSKVTDRLGSAFTFTYDAMDRVSKVTDDNDTASTLSYDALGRPATMVDRNAATYKFDYDPQGRPTKLTDGNNNSWQSTYNAEGVLASKTTPLGHTTTYTSDNMGRITNVSTPLSNESKFVFDAVGNLIRITDPAGNVSTQTFDAARQITGSTKPQSISASYQRNALGKVTRVTDPNGQNWQRTVDIAGRTTASVDPLSRTTSFGYDNRNRISTTTLPGELGEHTTNYDANGNIERRAYSDGTDLQFEYDAQDRLVTANGLSLTRDHLGQVTNSNGMAIAHDNGGRIISITYSTDKSVTYTYDANNNLASVTDWLGGISSFSYNKDNQMISMTRPNGVTATMGYDNDGRLISFAEGTLADTALTRDNKNQITSATRNMPTAASAADLANSNHSYDAASQINSDGFTFDAMGRLTQNGDISYQWDLGSRLTTSGETSYSYDAMGMQLSRTTATNSRQYVWNYALALPSVAIEKQAAADKHYYLYTPSGALLYSIDAVDNSRHFYHFDELGNTRFITDDAATVTASFAHTPFGQLTASSGETDTPFTWQGRFGIIDEGNGMYYVRARYYDSNTARFISPDPIDQIDKMLHNTDAPSSLAVNPMLLNPYQFASANPLGNVDLDGKEPFTIAVVLGGIGAAFTGLYKAGKQLELAEIEEQVARENARLLKEMDEPGCLADAYIIEQNLNKKRAATIIDASQTIAKNVPGSTVTGPASGAPVNDVSQTLTQKVLGFFGWDK